MLSAMSPTSAPHTKASKLADGAVPLHEDSGHTRFMMHQPGQSKSARRFEKAAIGNTADLHAFSAIPKSSIKDCAQSIALCGAQFATLTPSDYNDRDKKIASAEDSEEETTPEYWNSATSTNTSIDCDESQNTHAASQQQLLSTKGDHRAFIPAIQGSATTAISAEDDGSQVKQYREVAPRKERTSSSLVNPRDPYRDPFILSRFLKRAINLYKNSAGEVPEKHRALESSIKECLVDNLHQDQATNAVSQEASIEFYMAGFSPESATPAIVVTCPHNYHAHVTKVLSRNHIAAACGIIAHSHSRALQTRQRHPNLLHSEVDGRPLFQLHVLAEDKPLRRWLSAMMLDNRIFLEPDETLQSGSKLYEPRSGSRATVACVMQIQDRVGGLTTAHGFRDVQDTTNRDRGDKPAIASHTAYRLLVPDSKLEEKRMPDLDWTFMATPVEVMGREANDKDSTQISEELRVVSSHPLKERPVCIISSSSRVSHGILLCGVQYHMSSVQEVAVPLWLVELNDAQGKLALLLLFRLTIIYLRTGDSGSLVIDADTKDVYGYVVALDYADRVQIIPMHEAISQICHVFGTEEVSIASSIRGKASLPFESLNGSHKMNAEYDVADEMTIARSTQPVSPSSAKRKRADITNSDITSVDATIFHATNHDATTVQAFPTAHSVGKLSTQSRSKAEGPQDIRLSPSTLFRWQTDYTADIEYDYRCHSPPENYYPAPDGNDLKVIKSESVDAKSWPLKAYPYPRIRVSSSRTPGLTDRSSSSAASERPLTPPDQISAPLILASDKASFLESKQLLYTQQSILGDCVSSSDDRNKDEDFGSSFSLLTSNSQPTHMPAPVPKPSIKCDICGKVLNGNPNWLQSNLRRHQRAKHNPDAKSHFCKICNKSFHRKDNLWVHMQRCQLRKSTGHKPIDPPAISATAASGIQVSNENSPGR